VTAEQTGRVVACVVCHDEIRVPDNSSSERNADIDRVTSRRKPIGLKKFFLATDGSGWSGLGVCVAIAVAALSIASVCLIADFLVKSSSAPIFGALLLGAIIGVLLVYSTRCPDCKTFFAMKATGRTKGHYGVFLKRPKWKEYQCRQCGHTKWQDVEPRGGGGCGGGGCGGGGE
jgi:hypothetical protein